MFEEYTYGFREVCCIVCPKWAFYFTKWLFCPYSMSRAEYNILKIPELEHKETFLT